MKVTDKCTDCMVCSQICPTGNIKLQDNRIIFGDKCQFCLACVQFCPKEAIEVGWITKGRRRYHNRDVTIKELIEGEERF